MCTSAETSGSSSRDSRGMKWITSILARPGSAESATARSSNAEATTGSAGRSRTSRMAGVLRPAAPHPATTPSTSPSARSAPGSATANQVHDGLRNPSRYALAIFSAEKLPACVKLEFGGVAPRRRALASRTVAAAATVNPVMLRRRTGFRAPSPSAHWNGQEPNQTVRSRYRGSRGSRSSRPGARSA